MSMDIYESFEIREIRKLPVRHLSGIAGLAYAKKSEFRGILMLRKCPWTFLNPSKFAKSKSLLSSMFQV